MKYTPEQWDAFARELNDGGCPVLQDHAYKLSPVGLVIESIPGMNFSKAFSFQDGGAGYAIELVIRNEAIRAIDITEFQIKTPWGIPKVSLLPRERRSSNKYGFYCFPELGPQYEAEFVLNPFFARRKSRLLPGESMEGLLLVSSKESIPAQIGHLAPIVVTLTIFDSRQNGFSAQFGLRVQRLDILAREKAARRAKTKAKDTSARSHPTTRSLVAPPARKGLSKKEFEKILRVFVEEMETLKAKRAAAQEGPDSRSQTKTKV